MVVTVLHCMTDTCIIFDLRDSSNQQHSVFCDAVPKVVQSD